MTSNVTVNFRHYGAHSVEQIIGNIVSSLYIATHADVIHDQFYSAEQFADRLRGYAKAPGFEIVIGKIEDDPVGQAFGYPLPQNARWWHGLTTPTDPETIAENGSRTFALCELMVHPDWQRHGVAHSLHDELLRNRPERRATLLVREDNTAAQQAYTKWGWHRMGKLKPYPDSPHYDALILDLEK